MVTMNTSNQDRESGIPFFLEKVAVRKNVSLTSESMKIIWYWPKPTSQQDELGMWTYRYRNCIETKMDSFERTIKLGGSGNGHHIMRSSSENKTSTLEKVVAPKEISIPKAMSFHLLQYMANQFEAIDDEHLESHRHVPEGNASE